MTDERRASLLAYCRMDEPTSEELLTLETLYDFMVLRDFDLRDATITGTIVADNPAFRRLITQLKLTEPREGA